MIAPQEILPREIIKVLVEIDDVEEELYAKVLKNDEISLVVTYLVPTSKIYKGACIYAFESTVDRVNFDSICEHHAGIIDVTDVAFTNVGRNMFVLDREIIEEQDSDIDDLSDEEEDQYESDFVVSDSEEGATPRELGISDHKEVDQKWDEWQPSTSGGRHFKNVIDAIEYRVRHQADEKNFV
ncbi:hypothetical protein N9095_01235 [bacterium]|nr:hypothetical protein [bacterium]